MTHAEIVVIGRMERQLGYELDSGEMGRTESVRAPILVKVVSVLKGDVSGEIRITADFMCYRSFDLEDFEPGETYVFAADHTSKPGLYDLPSCSHTALKLVDGQLYTNDSTKDGRRLEPYMSLTLVRLLLPIGVLDTGVQILLAGVTLLLLPMLITPRIRGRTAKVVASDPQLTPMAALRSVNLRTGFAITWLLLCAGVCVFLAREDRGLPALAIGSVFALAFAFAAAGVALRWGWSEGLCYGLALLQVVFSVVFTYWAVGDYFRIYDDIQTPLVVFLSVVLLTNLIMFWCADAVRRRFSTANPAAR